MSTLLPPPRLSYWAHLWRVELVVLLSLLLYALALTLLLTLGAAVFASWPSFDGAALPFALILWFSVLPATFLFAPAYALLRWRGWVNLGLAIAMGLVIGLLFVRTGPLVLFAIPSAVIIATAAHLILKRM